MARQRTTRKRKPRAPSRFAPLSPEKQYPLSPAKPTAHAKPPHKTRAKGSVREKRTAGLLFEKLVALQARLRASNGCPWDREQTPTSLRRFLVEETYEVLYAVENGDSAELVGELGDLLLQIVFYALMGQEAGQFDIRDVIESVHDKMVRRHPHVFGTREARTSADVLRNWEQLKAEERKSSAESSQSASGLISLLDGIPRSLPGVLEAAKLTRRAAHIGFDWESANGVIDKVREECAEVQAALNDGKTSGEHSAALEEEVGDLLFAGVNLARYLGLDPEIALKKANRKFARRFRWMEAEAIRRNSKLAETPREEMELLWDLSKKFVGNAARSRKSSVADGMGLPRQLPVTGKQR
jgi:MazG family protein